MPGFAAHRASLGDSRARVGVVGHVEWVDFAVVDRFPQAGEIAVAREFFSEAAGGGAVAAVQMARLAGAATFACALGDDHFAARAREELAGRHGLTLLEAARAVPQRRAFTHLDARGERTITVLGERIVPHGDDDLAWDEVAALDAVYLTGGDAGAIERARAARVLVATPRAFDDLARADVELDVLVASATDAGEAVDPARLPRPPRHVVRTRGADGGEWEAADGTRGTWQAVAPPGEPVDAYGCGDSFAGGLAYALGAGMELPDALHLAATCGAWCLCGRGPYGNQLAAAHFAPAAADGA
ncbi:MAG: PfkB family carbohydrate kinase [Solirubrobacteraceae bacterium]